MLLISGRDLLSFALRFIEERALMLLSLDLLNQPLISLRIILVQPDLLDLYLERLAYLE